jgi:enamine deaminase RidA (YjgF/YER057c/UK114 family)
MKEDDMERRHLEGTWQKDFSFSPAVTTVGGRVIWLAGHGAPHDSAGKSLAGDFEAQVHETFKYLEATLKSMGGKLEDIVTMTVFILDVRHSRTFTNLRKQYFPSGRYPGSALITAAGFADPAMMVEIQGIAVVPE